MYSMVLLASLTTAGDAPAFGKKAGSCHGGAVVVAAAPAGCTGSMAASTGCHGRAPRSGFLGGLCHKNKGGCTGAVAAPVCCTPVAAPVVAAPPPPPAPVVVMAAPASCGCHGTAAPARARGGFLGGLCHKSKGCHG